MIPITAKGLAKFMTATPSGQRKVLRDFKYPDPEGSAQAAYYGEAHAFIVDHHRNGRGSDWLREKAALLATAASGLTGASATRLRSNSRAVADYATHFAAREFEVLPVRRFKLSYGEVLVKVDPELHVNSKGREKFAKLDFTKGATDDDIVRIVSQLMLEAALQNRLALTGSDILYLDVGSGTEHKVARIGARTKADIEAAAKNIEAMWDGIRR
jgi:hypothetical protein